MKIHNLNIKISACVIVKNEAENLPLWLEKMSQLADEMIVVDTGSEDNTKELAVAAGAQVYDYQWQDDFAAAKNYAISKAKGDWILFLDADEYFDEKSLKTTTGIDEIDNNKEIQKLNQELQDIYSSYYEQDSHDMPMWFNKEKQIKDKEEVRE